MKKNSADLILFNANVLTMEALNPRAQLVAIGGGKIIGVGKNSDIAAFNGSQTVLIDCQDKTVIPGFHDAHLHLFALVSSLLSIDCSPSSVSSIVDIKRLVASKAAQAHSGNWIRGSDYNEFALNEKRHPNRWDLDQAAPGHPVKLSHRTRQASVLNSMALSLAGITSQTPDPSGGIIDRDYETGEPTGLLFGMDRYLDNVIPPRPAEELDEGLRQANQLLLASGITSLQDATVQNGIDQWEQFCKIKGAGKLKPRVAMMFGFDALDRFLEAGLIAGAGDENLRLGAVKILIDETRGPLNPPQGELNGMVLRAHRAGFQVALHAVEENTSKAAIDAIEYARQQMPKADPRHRIEHCSECPAHLLQRLKELRATVVTQPAFLYYSGDRYLAQVAPEKLPWLYRVGAFQTNGIEVAFSSDSPVSPPSPLTGIYSAVTRKSESGQVISPQEAILAGQALRMYTLGGARSCFQEGAVGSIAIGKLADLVVLSVDPTAVRSDELKGIAVEKTIIGGEIAWEKADLSTTTI
ncbi:MAG: amidohydrolase [Dehalococcoidia bacterium]